MLTQLKAAKKAYQDFLSANADHWQELNNTVDEFIGIIPSYRGTTLLSKEGYEWHWGCHNPTPSASTVKELEDRFKEIVDLETRAFNEACR